MPVARFPAVTVLEPASAARPSPALTVIAGGTDPGLADLPDPGTERWVPRRKAIVVTAVRSGLITAEEACRRYALSLEELDSWCRRFEQFGISGLRVRYRPQQ